jgi:ribosomal protein S18 acetylase RimI-like enzyme
MRNYDQKNNEYSTDSNERLKKLNHINYVDAIEEGTAYFFEIFSSIKNKTLYKSSDISWIKSNIETFPNLIFGARFNKEDAFQRIRDISNKIKEGIAPNLWHIGPKTAPQDLFNMLIQNGFIECDEEGPGMALNLDEYNSKLIVPDKLKIKTISNNNEFKAWINIANDVLMGKGALDDCDYMEVLNEPTLKLFLAFWDDKPVATSMYALKDGVADIDIVATLKEYRNNGIGTAIAALPLLDLKKIGARTAVLRTSYSNMNLYKKIGFNEYCKYKVVKLAI